jgi:hypothetical protein
MTQGIGDTNANANTHQYYQSLKRLQHTPPPNSGLECTNVIGVVHLHSINRAQLNGIHVRHVFVWFGFSGRSLQPSLTFSLP